MRTCLGATRCPVAHRPCCASVRATREGDRVRHPPVHSGRRRHPLVVPAGRTTGPESVLPFAVVVAVAATSARGVAQ